MKKTAVAILLFAAAVSATTAEARKTTPETIYRKGWIDFNKNGRMTPTRTPRATSTNGSRTCSAA
ncbi:MAG: hypothetical protein V8Q54_06435 [Alistipes senegalensis]